MANNKNKSNYLLYAVLAIAFICGVLGVIAFVWEMTGKCKKTSKTTGNGGKGSGTGPDNYVERFRQSPYQIKEKFDLSQGTGAWSAMDTITNGTGSDVCNAANLPNKDYLVNQNVMDDGDVANSKDYTCQEFTLNSNNEVSGQGWFVGCQRPSDMLAPLYVAIANDCNPDGNVSNATDFQTGGTCSGVSNKTNAANVTIEKIATYFGKINSSGTGIDQTTLNQFSNSLDTHIAIWNATIGSYNDQGTPHANNNKLQAQFKQYDTSPNRWVKYYVMSDGNYFASDKPLNADFSVMDTVPTEMAMPNNASWEPQSVTNIGSNAKAAIETDPDVNAGTSVIQNIKNENVSYAQFQQAFRKMLYANGTGAYSADACLGSSVGSS